MLINLFQDSMMSNNVRRSKNKVQQTVLEHNKNKNVTHRTIHNTVSMGSDLHSATLYCPLRQSDSFELDVLSHLV